MATPDDIVAAVHRNEACVRDINAWMLCNKLMLSREKTDLN